MSKGRVIALAIGFILAVGVRISWTQNWLPDDPTRLLTVSVVGYFAWIFVVGLSFHLRPRWLFLLIGLGIVAYGVFGFEPANQRLDFSETLIQNIASSFPLAAFALSLFLSALSADSVPDREGEDEDEEGDAEWLY